MAEGRRREAWYHTALLASMQAEMNRDHKRRHRPFRESDFHPEGEAVYDRMRSAPAAKLTASDREMLRQAFPGKKK